MRILAIDTSCDETAAAVTEDTKVLSNIIWSQASLHAKWGGIVPSLAQREHHEHIDFVINKALTSAKCLMPNLNAIAVTVGPGLAIALEVGIGKAKELAKKFNKPLVAVNHLEGHVLSPLAQPKNSQYRVSGIELPALGLVISGGNTLLVRINQIGKYEVLARAIDDALGEALDKAARMLGLGYPGGAILEKMAEKGNSNFYSLPIPMLGREKEKVFSYSGLKTYMWKSVEKEKPLTKEKIQNLAASFQNVAFEHLIRVLRFILTNHQLPVTSYLFVGGGVSANNEIRKRLRKLGKKFNIKVCFPYTKKLCSDNAAMIGVAAYFKAQGGKFIEVDKIDRIPRMPITC